MLRVPINKPYLKRTFRPLYGWTQMTPKSMYLDPAWDRSVAIFPGMVMMRTSGENVSLANGTGAPYGFSALYVGGDGIDEVAEAGLNVTAVWVMADDAEAEILAPAFDDTLSWTEPGTGVDVLVHYSTAGANRGKLVPAGAANASASPVARLAKINSATKITIEGLTPRVLA